MARPSVMEKKRRCVGLYQKVFSTKQGREVLYDLMRGNFMIDRSPFVPGSPDTTAYNCGQRDVVVRILEILKMDPNDFIELEREENSHVD